MSAEPFAIVIPARYHSTRFPGKPLAIVAGRPLIEWVYLRARAVEGVGRVVVATDHEGIADAVRAVGGEAVITRADHPTGTDRVAEASSGLVERVIVNLQGDEPVVPAGLVEALVALLAEKPEADIATACHPIALPSQLDNPDCVKVALSAAGWALYFSRSPIPHGASAGSGVAMRHVGIYAFRRQALLRFASLPRGRLEVSEGLEQLRALENGMRMGVVEWAEATMGVDRPADLKNVEEKLRTQYTGGNPDLGLS